MRLIAGDDWAQDHHDIEVMDEAGQVLARTHKTLIWERSAVVLRLRARLREYFPAPVAASGDLDAPDALELPGKAPGPGREADPRPGLGGPQAGGPPQDHRAGRCDPGRAAQPAAGPAVRPDRCVRRCRAVPGRGDRHPQRAGR